MLGEDNSLMHGDRITLPCAEVKLLTCYGIKGLTRNNRESALVRGGKNFCTLGNIKCDMALKAEGSGEIRTNREVESTTPRKAVDCRLDSTAIVMNTVTDSTEITHVYSRTFGLGGEFMAALKSVRCNSIFCVRLKVEERKNVSISRENLFAVKINLVFSFLIVRKVVLPFKAGRRLGCKKCFNHDFTLISLFPLRPLLF